MKKSDLHPYQLECIQHIKEHPKCALFLEMGLGKTVSTLTAIHDLILNDLEVSKVLVVAPKRVAEQVWPAEIAEWEHLSTRLSCSIVSGSEKERKAALKERAHVYTISRDNIAWLINVMKPTDFDMLVIDELSSFKAPGTQRFKALRRYASSFERVVGLTGTPVPNGLIDIWAQAYLLDKGKRLEPYFTRFRSIYFRPGQGFGRFVSSWKLIPGAEKAIYKRLQDICITMRAEDYLQLPPLHKVVHKVQLDEVTLEKYRKLEKDYVLKMSDETLIADSSAALVNKLLQLSNGFIYKTEGEAEVFDNTKLDKLEELVEAMNGKPVLVAWMFKQDRDRILKRFEYLKAKNFSDLSDITHWNEGKLKMLLMHPASGGHGLNLQKGGSTVIWFSQTWSLELEQQLNARLYRQGQSDPTFIHYLIAKDTAEERVSAVRHNKDITQLDFVKQYIKSKL
jgi:SNF2 family DNA or RNA helicase